MNEEKDIIEVEILDSTLDSKEVHKEPAKAKHVKSDKRNKILFWGTIARACMRFGFPLAFSGGFGSLIFAILYGENQATFQLVFLIIAISMAGLGVLGVIFGIVSRAMMFHYMRLDPNYENQVNRDN